jgi:hypothetical protein
LRLLLGSSATRSINWGSIGVALALLLAIGQGIRTGFQASDRFEQSYRDVRARVRAAIEADRMIPALAELVLDAGRGIPARRLSPDQEATLRDRIEDNLQKTDYLERLDRLSTFAADHRRVSRCVEDATKWARLRGWALVLCAGAIIYPAAWVSVEGRRLATWPLIPTGLGAILGLLLAGLFAAQEIASRNRIADLSKAYV